MNTEDTLSAAERHLIENCLTDAHFPGLPNHYRGKVREAYDLPDGRRVMVATDRQSAFDLILAAVPHKGQVLNQTAQFWFEETRDICPNHAIDFPDPNVVVGQRLDMLAVEIVVRDYMTGSTETSIWPLYNRGERHLYGHDFPDGLVKNQKLPDTIITPTTKARQGGHDAPITASEIVESGLLRADIWAELEHISRTLFARGREIAAQNGLILVDTKYEFGLDETGRVTLADEIHTPDSSRFWIAESYEERLQAGLEPDSLDKEFLRLWITRRCDPYNEPVPDIPPETILDFSNRYVRLYEQITARPFVAPTSDQPIRDRIETNLAAAFPNFF